MRNISPLLLGLSLALVFAVGCNNPGNSGVQTNGTNAQSANTAKVASKVSPKGHEALIGTVLPAVPLESTDGKMSTLQIASDKPTVVLLWSSWCQACLHETKELTEWAKSRSDVNIMAINVNELTGDPADIPLVRSAAEKLGLSGPVWMAREANLPALGLRSCPTMYVVNKQGVVKAARLGYKGPAEMNTWLDQGLHAILAV